MMTVSITVNGLVVYARTLKRIINEDQTDGKRCYELDDGTRIWHNPKKGIIPLSIEALKKIDDIIFLDKMRNSD